METVTVQFEISETAIERYRADGVLTVIDYTRDDIARTIVHGALTVADNGHDLGPVSSTWKVLDTAPLVRILDTCGERAPAEQKVAEIEKYVRELLG